MSRDPFEGIPRVPKTDESGIQIGAGGIAPNKKYARVGVVDDYREAAANYVKRKKGTMAEIQGGINDESPELYMKADAISPFSKMKVAQTHSLSQEEVKKLKEGKKESVKTAEPVQVEVPKVEVAAPRVIVPPSQTVTIPTTESIQYEDPFGGPAGKVQQETTGYAQDLPPQPKVQIVYQDRIIEKPVEKIVEKVVEKDSPGHEWLKKRVRVQVGLQETTFSISAVDVIRSLHALTIILPTVNDAMTFTPRTGAKVMIQTKDLGTIETMFTGASFELEALGIFGLSFLIPNKKEDDNES